MRIIEGIKHGTGEPAEFAICKTNDGKLTYFGALSGTLTHEELEQKLREEMAKRGLTEVNE